MKICYYFIFYVLVISCSKQRNAEYENILKSLESNYTVNCNSKSSFLFCWKKNEKLFLKDSIEYKVGLKKFYSQDSKFMKYIIKNRTKGINQCIKRDNLCDSNVSKDTRISNEYAIKILIDNLILNNQNDTILINKYVNKLDIKKLEKIIFDDIDIKQKYKEYIKMN